MQVKNYTNYIHITPRKLRLVADLIRGLDIEKAEEQLLFSKKRAAGIILKALKAAVNSAEHNFSLDKKNLYISKITVNEGPKMKRWRAAAFGSTHQITKRTSHLMIVLEEKIQSHKENKKEKPEVKKKEKIFSEKTKEIKQGLKEKIIKKKNGIKYPEKTRKSLKAQKGFFHKIFQRKSGI